MVRIFAVKTISGNPYDAMDTTFVSVFSRFSPEDAEYLTDAPERFEERGAIRKMPLGGARGFTRLIRKILLMRRVRPDWLFGYGGVADLPFILFRPRGTKYVINYHSILVRHATKDWPVRTPWAARRFIMRRADVIVAISEFARRTILAEFPDARVELVYSGVDTAFFGPERRDKEALRAKYGIGFTKPLVVYMGTLQSRKRPDIFIAVAGLCPQFDFLVVGKGDPAFLEPARGLANFQYVERMGREDVARLFASADALLFPSLQEPFGLVVVEAMASGLPAVVSASGAFPELVRSGIDGVLVPVESGEIAAFADALNAIIRSSDTAVRFRKNAVLGAARFDWEATARGYERLLLATVS